jgi:hypothetical protein
MKKQVLVKPKKIPEGYYDDSNDNKELLKVGAILGSYLLIPKIVNWRDK